MTLSRAKLSNSNVNPNTSNSANGTSHSVTNFVFECSDCSSTSKR